MRFFILAVLMLLFKSNNVIAAGYSYCSARSYTCAGIYYPGCSTTCSYSSSARCRQGNCYSSGYGSQYNIGSNECFCQ